jgi:hypothetical protein
MHVTTNEGLILLGAKQRYLPKNLTKSLDKLLEGTVDGRAKWLDILVEVDSEKGALSDAFGSELEFL